ncbi:MAG: HPF/RaiA family ribosome-associated protein [Actinobacteria bacterium]|nr:HPF/RaiA family ribosome-associated protein [Actinomycetota bacterium]
MQIAIVTPGVELEPATKDRFEDDLAKLTRRLGNDETAVCNAKLNRGERNLVHVVLEVHQGKRHYLAKSDDKDANLALRKARDEVIRQVNDHSRGGHSQYAKGH